MALYVIEYTYDHSLASLLQTFRPAHRQFLRDLNAKGVLVASGWLREGSEEGALIILHADSAAAAAAHLEEDPFNVQGFIVQRRVREWIPTIGEGAEGFDTDFPIS
ncbi:hypothetical protein I6B53_05565 [Schaalia sp. 19OD2882]|uniref:YciI family protein n=1 Tax=Schaalia sp. 19OD2882 TaxID=2794089 RepID=UPI001C1ED2D0|nr:YciI family protein [Schaalia sp. 19OD2882]QWW20527.1 hypothetical protein I6B53_05565 [Schaalia sp. 19OD2882]